MARIFQTGFETGGVGIFDVNQSSSLVTSPVVGGAYALQHTNRPGNQKQLPATYSEVYVRAHIQHNNASAGLDFLAFRYSAGTSVEHQVGFGIFNGFVGWTNNNRTLVNTGTVFIPVNTWALFEAHFTVATSTGIVQTKINSVTDLNLTGKATNGQGGGVIDRISFDSDTGLMGLYSDDWALNDTSGSANNSWIGEGKIVGLVPTAAGDTTTLNGTVGSATHWQNVDELPANDATDYNYDNAVSGTNHYDLYNLTNPGNVGVVNAITTWVRAQKDDAGTGNFRFVHKIGGTEYRDAADIGLSQSWAYYSQIREQNPNSSAAWTSTDLTNLQAGFDAR